MVTLLVRPRLNQTTDCSQKHCQAPVPRRKSSSDGALFHSWCSHTCIPRPGASRVSRCGAGTMHSRGHGSSTCVTEQLQTCSQGQVPLAPACAQTYELVTRGQGSESRGWFRARFQGCGAGRIPRPLVCGFYPSPLHTEVAFRCQGLLTFQKAGSNPLRQSETGPRCLESLFRILRWTGT